jgi:hypothetical protein
MAIACSTRSEDSTSSTEGLSGDDDDAPTFTADDVIEDGAFADVNALDRDGIQAFLESTPFTSVVVFHTRSALADYQEGGKTAADILAATARRYQISPIELLVALEAEQSLISATTADTTATSLAFRCGCPDGDECALDQSKYLGFAKQADCYGATIRASLELQKAGKATGAGWRKGTAHLSNDKPKAIVVTPKNYATAALYSYTPIVGSGGGGDTSLGGVSLHWKLFGDFTKALDYTAPTVDPSSAIAACDPTACAGSAPVCVADAKTCGCTDDASCGDGRTCRHELGPAGICFGTVKKDPPPPVTSAPTSETPVLTPPPATTGELPSGHVSDDREAPVKTAPALAPLAPPPTGAGVGCSSSGTSRPNEFAFVVLTLAAVLSARRRSSASRG